MFCAGDLVLHQHVQSLSNCNKYCTNSHSGYIKIWVLPVSAGMIDLSLLLYLITWGWSHHFLIIAVLVLLAIGSLSGQCYADMKSKHLKVINIKWYARSTRFTRFFYFSGLAVFLCYRAYKTKLFVFYVQDMLKTRNHSLRYTMSGIAPPAPPAPQSPAPPHGNDDDKPFICSTICPLEGCHGVKPKMIYMVSHCG